MTKYSVKSVHTATVERTTDVDVREPSDIPAALAKGKVTGENVLTVDADPIRIDTVATAKDAKATKADAADAAKA